MLDLNELRSRARVPAPTGFKSRRLTSIAAAILTASGVALLTAATRTAEPRAPACRFVGAAGTVTAVAAGRADVLVGARAQRRRYEFQLFRGAERVFRARVEQPRLELPQRWRESNRAHTLEPGNYVWYVWPISRRTNQRVTAAIVRARLVVG